MIDILAKLLPLNVLNYEVTEGRMPTCRANVVFAGRAIELTLWKYPGPDGTITVIGRFDAGSTRPPWWNRQSSAEQSRRHAGVVATRYADTSAAAFGFCFVTSDLAPLVGYGIFLCTDPYPTYYFGQFLDQNPETTDRLSNEIRIRWHLDARVRRDFPLEPQPCPSTR